MIEKWSECSGHFCKANNSTNIHSDSFWSQSQPIWTNLKSEAFRVFQTTVWNESEGNLKPIWNLKSQSEPIWTNMKYGVFTIFQTTSMKWIWKQSEANLKSEKLTPQRRPVSPPSSLRLISLLPSAPPPPRRPIARPWLSSCSQLSSLPPWPAVLR